MIVEGMRLVRIPAFLGLLAAIVPLQAPALAAPPKAAISKPAISADSITDEIRDRSGGAVKRFYADRDFRPLWVEAGRIGPAAQTLIGYLQSADLDGLKPSSYKVDTLEKLVDEARDGDAEALARAEVALTESFARYVRDLRRPVKVGMTYAKPLREPKRPNIRTVLQAASFPKSFSGYLKQMGWMSEHYVQLRALMDQARKSGASDEELDRLRLNLNRARVLPGPWVYHVVVDSSSGNLWYYGSGKRVGTMRVVVGTPETPTPMMAGELHWAILRPYWNVPVSLVQNNIAPKVLAGRSLSSMQMEAFSDWSDDARKLDASEIDWHAVAAGSQTIRLREKPGGSNSMGRVKFLFPNTEGIYLHDTPSKDLLKKPERHFSNGCIRLEKAGELGKWLTQRSIWTKDATPEQAVALPAPVPVYLTYLTAYDAGKGRLAFRPDVYGRDE